MGLCTDSNSQLPAELAARYGVEVVPLTVTIDGDAFLEGENLDADQFWARFEQGVTTVTTAAPSPGRFASAYSALAERGAGQVLSVHIGSAVSATLGAARLGAALAPVPVRLVDTGTASFGVACCLWEAAEALARGADLEEAATVAEDVARRTGNVFVVRAPDLARRGGRLGPVGGLQGRPGPGPPAVAGGSSSPVPVLSLVEGRMVEVATAATLDQAAEAMAGYILGSAGAGSGPGRLRVGVGVADTGAAPLWQALEQRMASAEEVVDVVRYRIGPSVGAHTGPGSAGAFFYPIS